MNSLENYKNIKQQALSGHRPCYPVPQYMSEKDKLKMQGARNELERSYHKELAKPVSQRNLDLVLEMDRQLHPRLCGW